EGREVERGMVARELPDLPARPLPGAAAGERPSRVGLPLWLLRTGLAARRTLREERVDCVVSTGGRASVPVGLAARSLGVPLFLLEQNAITGRANRWLAPFAKRMYRGLPAAGRRDPGFVTGTPLRPEVGRIARERARHELGLVGAAPLVLVVGGSQGAQALNEAVPAALRRLDLPLAVVHLAGSGHDGDVARRYRRGSDGSGSDGLGPDGGDPNAGPALDAIVLPTASDMARLYAAADLVVCRGGGTTVAELVAAGRAAVIVPYPHHRDRQQFENAKVLAAVDAAVIVEQQELDPVGLADVLGALLGDPARLRRMGEAARKVNAGDATTAIVDDIERINGWSAGGA
ncbi:MAG: UDP-N-acetylglucosamine--N-acetylmuramyl-(pentapeptide) pyrophosphoryl-undecaprenol N-acetylglucosamine transferase, partial [Planctomycetes bacterium]|nr:UDP-N-acetylglucosamine--N-acetylmuramyl-(pentapeptide) pyrophosphoryl-undecaprenol N-acetylglucosamine transferase [Planctomycetota bacterium]